VRFFEFNQTDKGLEAALVNALNQLRGEADDHKQASEISFDAVSQIMKNTGYPTFNFNLFKALYDQGKVLKNIVGDFNQEKITLKTEKEADKDPAMDYDNLGSTDKVKQMAKSALQKRT